MKRLLLAGAGHAHAQVLKAWIDAPLAGCELVVVSPHALAPYSGMVPGWLAGLYRYDAICIDFQALAAAAGARLVLDELTGLDPDRRRARLASGAVLDYDLLSLNVGSTLTPPVVGPGTRMLALRPLGELRTAWEALLDALQAAPADDAPLDITAVGGGAGGVESLLATLAQLRAMRPDRVLRGRLVTRSDTLLPGMAPGAIRSTEQALVAAGVTVQTNTTFDPADAPPGLLLWATGAQAHGWQRDCGLAVNAGGFIRVDACLRSVSHANVYAVGDCAGWEQPLPKAGVFAVRMGPVLADNLRAALTGRAPRRYDPQRRYLALLSTADGRAIASWGRWSLRGRWVWRWKDHIDRGFLRRFEMPGRADAADRIEPPLTPPRSTPGDPA